MGETKPTATIELVPIAQVKANPMNPRSHFGSKEEVAELIAEFDENPVYPGEPWDPITVVRDGDVYRIADGECRWRAMKKAGKLTECHARVFDTMEEAAQMLMMLDTNRKRELTAGEYGYGLQTAMMLGVPEERVERRAGRKCADALRRQMERNGGKAVQMSIDQMLAADEFADDEELYREIVEAGDSTSWKYAADRKRRARKAEQANRDAEAAAAAAIAAHGLTVADAPPKGALLERSLYGDVDVSITKSAAEWAASGWVLVRRHEGRWGAMEPWQVYSPKPARTPEEEAAAKTKNGLRKQAQAGRKRRREWVAGKLMPGNFPGSIPNTLAMVAGYLREHRMYEAEEFFDKAGIDSGNVFDDGRDRRAVFCCEYTVASSWMAIDAMTNYCVDAIGGTDAAKWNGEIKAAAERYVAVIDALAADGYQATEEETAFRALCAKGTAESVDDIDREELRAAGNHGTGRASRAGTRQRTGTTSWSARSRAGSTSPPPRCRTA